jgi:hypothetical protein
MSRADELRAALAAELAVLELEDELAAAKESGDVPRELKLRLREARRVFREQRAGAAVASPATVTAAASVEEV